MDTAPHSIDSGTGCALLTVEAAADQLSVSRTRAPNGASSIYQGNDGKWHGRVTVGVLDNGKPDRRHIERKT
jgi:hypothetical protein